MSVVLAIDGGGSRTRCLAVNRAGKIIGEATSGPSNHLLVDKIIVARSLTEAIETCLTTARLGRTDIACLSAGLAGVDYDGTGAAEMIELLGGVGFTEPVINGDMVIAHAGALGGRAGVVALSGTGSCVLGIGVNGERVKVGGWGPIYGDEGSAYRIGEMSLRAAARAYDRSGPATALVHSLTNALGLSDFKETVPRIYVEAMQPREIAALSRVAYEVAEAGDEVARTIFLQAGEELAESVIAAVRQLELDETVVSYQGSVIESCHLLRQQFIDKLQRTIEVAEVVPPEFEPVMGAYLLGCKALGW
ncbi:MAG TPA: BadF/BadG/BcrA/BcrD ATPase family protein [Pyrinomonadaceae bacterium]|jgi:N-acetylglucosamine kinase-like BadF-type ATPase